MIMSLKILSESDVTPANICVFCKKNTVNELRFGPLYYRDGVVTHYFCMLFSAALSQSGSDDQGILGFLPPDIAKEVRRSGRLKCFYCEEVGASIGCCNKRCRKAFHFPCGLQNRTNFQFFGNFESYCEDHAKLQKITLKVADWICPVCMGPVSNSERPIQASCCKAAVFHKDCMQKVALNAGYFFKCPTCNASKNFTQEMRSLGIYVPQQDASWEREPNAYEDLLYQYSKCDAETCECPEGRENVTEKGHWTLARCRICGASGMHKKCGNLRVIDNWACAVCLEIEKKADLEKKRIKQENALKQRSLADSNIIDQKNGTEEIDDTDDFNMSKVKISDTCYQYFPYDKEDLQKYANRESLPDWRNLQLTVNLSNWIQFVTVKGPEVCSSRKNTPDDGDKKSPKKGKNPRAITVNDEMVFTDTIHAKSMDEDSIFMTLAKKIKEKKEEIANGDGETENISKDSDSDNIGKNHSKSSVDNDNFDTSISDSEQNYLEDSSKTKPKCAIFPFVTNFLKSKMFIRDKRKIDMDLQLGQSPPKKLMLCNAAYAENSKEGDDFNDKDSPKSDKLNVPNNAPSAEKQVVVWRNNGQQHDSPRTLEFSKELADLYNEIPSPQSLVFSFTSSHLNGLSNHCRLPALTCNAYQSLSSSQSNKDFLHIADLTLPSSRHPSSEPVESAVGPIQNSLFLATKSPKATNLSDQSECGEEDTATSISNQIVLRNIFPLLDGSITEETEDFGKS